MQSIEKFYPSFSVYTSHQEGLSWELCAYTTLPLLSASVQFFSVSLTGMNN